MTDDLPPMLSLIQTLCRLHLRHLWEPYLGLRGRAQRGAIRTEFTELDGKTRLHLQPRDTGDCRRHRLLPPPPNPKPRSVQTQKIPEKSKLLILSKCHCARTRCQALWYFANDIPDTQPHFCSHSAVCAAKVKAKRIAGAGGALVRTLAVSLTMWNIAL